MTKHGLLAFHIVDESPWPLYMSLGSCAFMACLTEFISLLSFNPLKFVVVFSFTMLCFVGWVRDISHEGAFLGEHTLFVQKGLSMGFVLFIMSEVMFFVSFFWSLFYFSMSPSVEIGGWPPSGLLSVDPLGVPLLGSVLLMSSGISVTWSHYSVLSGQKSDALMALYTTLLLGVMFTTLQIMEYLENSFCMSDSVYGSIFYMATGFHGLHVLIGSIFLAVCLARIKSNQMSKLHHSGFEFSIWYWHFVDVVWLILYLFLYWWGW